MFKSIIGLCSSITILGVLFLIGDTSSKNKRIKFLESALEFKKQEWEAEHWFLIKTKKELNKLKYGTGKED